MPGLGVGMVSRLCGVEIKVNISTRATSLGSVRASQLYSNSSRPEFSEELVLNKKD